jgi:hypothetical protein
VTDLASGPLDETELDYRRFKLSRLSDVRSRTIQFLVPGMIPLRTLTLVAGIGGIAKSMWLAAITAELTTRPDDPCDVIVISYEDTAEEIWRPRVLAANGNAERVHFVNVDLDDGGVVVLPEDVFDLELAIRQTNAKLVIIDPVVASIDTALDTHKDQHVRVVLSKLVSIAEQTDCAISAVGHLNKTPSKDFYIRVGNSVAFWNAARSVVLVSEDEDEDDRLVSQVKANWARRRPIQRWRIEGVVLPEEIDPATGAPIETARMSFVEDATDVDPATLLDGRKAGEPTKTDLAIEYLENALADGDWHEKEGLAKLAAPYGVTEKTLERAATRLNVERDRRGFPATAWWALTSSDTPSSTVHVLSEQEPHG